MRYFKRYWDESSGRGDPRNSWGCSWWYFEADSSGNVERQITAYDHGPIVRYDLAHLHDEFGRLAEKPIDVVEFAIYEIYKAAFEKAWIDPTVINARPLR